MSMIMRDNNGGDRFEIINGGERVDRTVSIPSHLSFLTSKDRDFMLLSDGTQVNINDLEGKVIGLYFSANWYSPCQTFNQLLIKTYNQIEKLHPFKFEVVFVSSDENIDAFTNYFSTMPWLSIPFSDLSTKKYLNKKFDVEGIPCLVILQPDSWEEDSVVRDGVEIVYRFGAEGFPFSRERLEELEVEERERHGKQTLVTLLTNQDRDFLLGHPEPVPVKSLIGKTVGLYFSAQWCGPGVKFTYKLKPIYRKIKELLAQNKNTEDFEIVFVPTDRDITEFNSHFETMPWPALHFDDPNIKYLTKYFDIRGIPCLVILGPDGKTVTRHGRNLVNLYKEDAYPFTESRVGFLESQMDELARDLPRREKHAGHRHELTLVSEGSGGGPFICCDCDEQGSGWAYQCIECGYEVHTKCVRPMGQGPSDDAS